jgi:hypothetical protein
VLGSEDWIVSQLNAPGLYVDSVLGNDANPGTEASPLQHLYAVTATLGANSTIATNIYLKRGSKFYESFVVPTNAFVCDYSVGVKPIITGVTNLANGSFSLTLGKTDTYQMPLLVPIETNPYSFNLTQSNVLMVWQANQRLGARWDQNASYNNNTNTAINSVDGNPNSFFYDLTNHVLYLNTSTNGNPATNGLVYEASIRTLALVGSAGITVSNVIAEKSYAYDSGGNEGYAILGQSSGTFINCVGRHSWNHCIGFAPPLAYVGTNAFLNCYGWDVESNITYTAPGSVFVADCGSATNLTTFPVCGIFSNCLAVATPSGVASADSGEFTIGYYGHLLTNLVVKLYGCVASNCYYGYGGGQTNFAVETNCVAVNCFNGLETINGTDTIDHFFAYNCTNGVIGQSGTTNLIVNNSQFWEMNSAGIWGRTTTNMFMTNNIFASTNALGTGIESSFGLVPVWSYSNAFWQLSQAYSGGMMTNLSGANTADYNDYYGNTRVAGNEIPSPGYATSFANWQSMWPSVDPHGTTSNPSYPSGDFSYNGVALSGSDSNIVVNVPSWIAIQNGGGLTNLQGSSLTGNVIAPGNFYGQKTNFANYAWITNLFKGQGGGVLTGNFNDALDLYADAGGDNISIFHANGGNTVVFDQNADVTLSGGFFTGDGHGINNLNASSLASGSVPYAVLPSQVVTNGAGVPLTNIMGGVTNITSPGGTTNWSATVTNMTGYWNGFPWSSNITPSVVTVNYTITNELQPGGSIWMVFSNSATYGYPWLSAYANCSVALTANATAVCPTNAAQATAFWLGTSSSGIFRHWEQSGSGTTTSLGGTDATTTATSGNVGSFSAYQGTTTGSIYYTPSSTNLMDVAVTVTAMFAR